MATIIGTAGWSIPGQIAPQFGDQGTGLARYASRLDGVEINSSFYRPHRPDTWRRWADGVPDNFRFSVKMPRTISHEHRLADCDDQVARFVAAVGGLGGKLAVLLLQLPPSLRYDAALFADFIGMVRDLTDTPLACEPRHPDWFKPAVEDDLARLQVARVAADPACLPAGQVPGGWTGLRYRRLHGSPHIYRSSYPHAYLRALVHDLRAEPQTPSWCIFDNTAAGAAAANALFVRHLLDLDDPGPCR